MKMQKRQFRIGELAKTLGVERFVIRFWEKEFRFSAHRSEGGQRFYSEKDLLRFKYIKTLLYEQGFTIAGAIKQLTHPTSKDDNQFIASHKTSITKELSDEKQPNAAIIYELKSVRAKLFELKNILSL